MGGLQRKLKLARTMVRLGPSTLYNFGLHRLRVRNGFYAKTLPVGAWAAAPPVWATQGRSPFPVADLPAIRETMTDQAEAIATGDRILGGELRYFSHHWLPFDGWRRNPHTGFETRTDHWSRIPDFNPEQGDIKWVWEASRFDWVYALARAWAATGDERYVEHFWTSLDAWREQDAPNCGANWKCGQESSLRLFALAWAAGAFASCKATTSDRLARLWETVGALAERVQPAIGYAVAQRNNHALSEAAGLTLAAYCLPNHPKALEWARLGRQVMNRQVAVQFAPDGSYAQNANNYTRIALRDLFIYAVTLQAAGETIDPLVRDRALAAANLLYGMHDPVTGRVPNYGANDGANILSLSGAGYLDYRPLIQATSVGLGGKRLLPPGPWDEEIRWHFGRRDFPLAPKPLESFRADDGGYFGLRGPRSFGLLRCHSHRMPPSHADMLALDLWIGGVNLCPDKGTYQYYDPRNLGTYFASTAAHNTVDVDGESQMIAGTRFLWLDWVKSRLLEFAPDGSHFSGEHDGYLERFGITHRRTVYRAGDEYLIVDDLVSKSGPTHIFTLRWHLAGEDWCREDRTATSPSLRQTVTVVASGGDELELLQGPTHSPETEESLYYGALSPLSLLKATVQSDASYRWVTIVGPRATTVEGGKIEWHGLTVPIQAGAPATGRLNPTQTS